MIAYFDTIETSYAFFAIENITLIKCHYFSIKKKKKIQNPENLQNYF